ncbi:hypothetical protein Emed_003911 [Eimeria media]
MRATFRWRQQGLFLAAATLLLPILSLAEADSPNTLTFSNNGATMRGIVASPGAHVERSHTPEGLPEKMPGSSSGISLSSLRRRVHLKFVAKTSLIMVAVAALTFLVMRCMTHMVNQPHAVSLRRLSDEQPGPSKCDDGPGDEDADDSDGGGAAGGGPLPSKPQVPLLNVPLIPIPWTNLPYEEFLKIERVLYDSGGAGKRCKAMLSFLGVLQGARLAALVARSFAQEAVTLAPLFRPHCMPLLEEPINRNLALVEKALYRLAHYPGTSPHTVVVMLQSTRQLLKAIRDNPYPVNVKEAERRVRVTRGTKSWHAITYWVRQVMDSLLRVNPGGNPPHEFAELVLDRLTQMITAREAQLLECPVVGHRLAQYNMLIGIGVGCSNATPPPAGPIIQPLPTPEIQALNVFLADVLPDVEQPTDSAATQSDIGAIPTSALGQPPPSVTLQASGPQLPGLVYELPAIAPGAIHVPPQSFPGGQHTPQVAPPEEGPGAAAQWLPPSSTGAMPYPRDVQPGAFVAQPEGETPLDYTDPWMSGEGYNYYGDEEDGAVGHDETYADYGETEDQDDDAFYGPSQTEDGAYGEEFYEEVGWIPEDADDQDESSEFAPHDYIQPGQSESTPWSEAPEEAAGPPVPTAPPSTATHPSVDPGEEAKYFLPSGLLDSPDPADTADSTSAASPLTPSSAPSPQVPPGSVTQAEEPYFHLPSSILIAIGPAPTEDSTHGPSSPPGDTPGSPPPLPQLLQPFIHWGSRGGPGNISAALPQGTAGGGNNNVHQSPSSPPTSLLLGAQGTSTSAPAPPSAAPSGGTPPSSIEFFLPYDLLAALDASPTDDGEGKPPSK